MFSFCDVIMDFLYKNCFILTHIPLFPRVQIAISQHRFMALNRRQAIICTNDTLVYWRIYASFDIDKLIYDRCRQRQSFANVCNRLFDPHFCSRYASVSVRFCANAIRSRTIIQDNWFVKCLRVSCQILILFTLLRVYFPFSLVVMKHQLVLNKKA